MSDTDDTDILLLIPPNFFYERNSGDSEDSLLQSSRTVVHKPRSCTSHVIGKLVTQVHSLENRLESLELTATDTLSSRVAFDGNKTCDYSISFDSYSLDRKSLTFPRARKRKVVPKRRKRRDSTLTSLESLNTYERKLSPLNLKDNPPVIYDFQSMDGDVSSIVSTPNKKNDKLFLHEIDEFLHKVESYESPEGQYKVPESTLSPQQVIRATGDYFTQKLNSNNVSTESKLSEKQAQNAILDKYIYLMQNPLIDEDNEKKNEDRPSQFIDNTPKSSNTHSVAHNNLSPAYRKLQFPEVNKEVQPTSTPIKITTHTNLSNRNAPSYTSRFRPSNNKVYDRASKVLDQYKCSSSRTIDDTVDTNFLIKDDDKLRNRHYGEDFKVPKDVLKGTHKFMDTIDSELLSLSDLWGSKGDKVESGKLEEERLKREHCEAMIQELQKKLLDKQERIAVAMKVDRVKDAAINKLKDAWHQITGALEKNEGKHNSAMNKMEAEVQQNRQMACDFQKKAEHFEGELYKTLDLAHDYQEKCKLLMKEKQESEAKTTLLLSDKDEMIKQKDSEISDLRDNYETVMRLNKQTGECIKNLEIALEKEQLEHNITRSKILDINKKTETITEETTLLIQERDLLKEKNNEERARNNMLEKQLAEKNCVVKAIQKREETLENEILELRKQLEIQKNDLKGHYQRQLEEAVLCKLQEFQLQLEQAEREMETEGRSKEMSLLDNFNKQIARVQEQHKLEVSVLEEKHKEEVKLYRLQIAQATEKANLMEGKVDTYRRRRSQLASQLHGVMEAQWRQALSILTTPTADVTHASTPVCQDYGPSKIPPLTMPPSESSFKLTEDKLTEKLMNFDTFSDSELQTYVKTLLQKPVCLDTSDKLQSQVECDTNEQPTSDRARHRQGKHKPPWKS